MKRRRLAGMVLESIADFAFTCLLLSLVATFITGGEAWLHRFVDGNHGWVPIVFWSVVSVVAIAIKAYREVREKKA